MWIKSLFALLRTAPYAYHDRGYRTEVNGLNVHAVEGLHGVALIPKVLIEKEVKVPRREPTHRDASLLAAALRQIQSTITVSECQKIAREALGE